jgi:hypothetical protein
MTNDQSFVNLDAAISARALLHQIISTLREYRRPGVTREEVKHARVLLRNQPQDEATEDRILELVDIVSGFCAHDKTVWED